MSLARSPFSSPSRSPVRLPSFRPTIPINVEDMSWEQYAGEFRNVMEQVAIEKEDSLLDNEFIYYKFNNHFHLFEKSKNEFDWVFAAKTPLGAYFLYLEQAYQEGIKGTNISTYEGLSEINWDSSEYPITTEIVEGSVENALNETFGFDVEVIEDISKIDPNIPIYYFKTSSEIKSASKR